MNRGLAFSLAAFAVLAVALAWLLSPSSRKGLDTSELGLVLPGLAADLNTVDRLEMADAQDTLDLSRIDGLWQLTQLPGLPINQGKVREFLLDLAQSVLIETKTDDPKYHDALDLGGDGTTIEIGDGNGLVVGKTATGTGRFVRRIGDNQSYIAKDISVPPLRLKNWTDFDMPTAPRDSVTRVDIDDGIAPYSVVVSEEGQTLVGLQPTEALAYETVLDSVVAGAVFLDFDSVRLASEVDWDDAGTTVFHGAEDGDLLTYRIAQQDEALWLRAAPEGSFVPDASVDWRKWAFEISDYRKQTLLKPRADLLADEDAVAP